MFYCPGCNREIEREVMCKCGADLTLLQQIRVWSDELFNEALDFYKAGEKRKALERLDRNKKLVPFDNEARIFQAMLLVELDMFEQAKEVAETITKTDPNFSGLDLLQDILREKKEKENE